MEHFFFFSKLINVVFWPFVTLVIGFVMRDILGNLLPTLHTVNEVTVEGEFNTEIRRVIDKSQALLADKQMDSEGGSRNTKIALAKIHSSRKKPTKMVLEAWRSVDGALFRFANDAGISIGQKIGSGDIYERVISTDLLKPQTKELVMKVYEMRNRVSIANLNPSLGSAKDYLIAVEQVVNLVEEERKTVEKVVNES
ncbi:hypothetical protein [Vibrio parahaemolyticus]|uniref:hypothetical protein n=1 Tax=Vibrio parahaemolyticus TaxID=670 RepID=UPI001B818B7C|nr:hypothetical protein [Vibrio parahaemolyticus]ELC3206110.1 hypothetical protein [Vibrio parahaemolyticus]MCI9688706.1 hypothetical protein [Vibrio parahaemolyticus]MCR9696642.1 hypothetical protein [Vibrio parahaemolyticus]MCR9763063.1 hypothetical protein [Vibrio parahaemolyticus]MCR9815060.1 hypothetical protein [Vibrio parahaemolyticus]